MTSLCEDCKWHDMRGDVAKCAAGYLDAIEDIYPVVVDVVACHQYEQEEDNDE